MKPPSFEPWLGRVRLARACVAACGFLLVVVMGYDGGLGLDDAVLRGLGAAVVCYFVGWASALWICSELYNAQIGRIRRTLQDRESARHQQLQTMYDQRMESMNEAMGLNSPVAVSPMSPPVHARRDAA